MISDERQTTAIGGHVTLTAKEGREKELATVLIEARCAVRTEAGCVYYDVFRSRDDPRTFHLLEKYVDHAALKTHLATAHARAMQTLLANLLETEPTIVLMTELR